MSCLRCRLWLWIWRKVWSTRSSKAISERSLIKGRSLTMSAEREITGLMDSITTGKCIWMISSRNYEEPPNSAIPFSVFLWLTHSVVGQVRVLDHTSWVYWLTIIQKYLDLRPQCSPRPMTMWSHRHTIVSFPSINWLNMQIVCFQSITRPSSISSSRPKTLPKPD